MDEAVSHHRQNLAEEQNSENKTATPDWKNTREIVGVKTNCVFKVALKACSNLAQLGSLLPTF